jgi:undecaprenyl diphosphate synthase
MFQSSTAVVPAVSHVPVHVAIIMDGNGRWAQQRRLPRLAGHTRGVDAVRSCVKTCGEIGVKYLTLFAFSSENWRRPQEEVSYLMRLFNMALDREVSRLQNNNIRLRVVGDLSAFDEKLRDKIQHAHELTQHNSALTLTIAANYGGRWDILQATQRMLAAHPRLKPEEVTEAMFASYLAMADYPEPDLFVRTGGEQRISNFLLWQLAYTELYFTDANWPDFGGQALKEAIKSYQTRERRFGRTSQQLVPVTEESAAC